MEEELFAAKGNVLQLRRNPSLTEIDSVKGALLKILREDDFGAEMDMTAMSGISSMTVGMAVAVHLRAVEAGRKLTVRIRPDQKRLFELTMLSNTLNLEVAGAG
jgi:hypothetical protein